MAIALVTKTQSEQIVSRIVAGDVQGLEDLHVVFGPIIKSRLLLKLRQDWEDCYTTVLYNVFTAIRKHGMHEPGALPGLVVTIVDRTIIHEFRRRKETCPIEPIAHEVDARTSVLVPNPHQHLEAQERTSLIRWGLDMLPPLDRAILRRFYLEGQSPNQIRDELKLTETQFRLRKCRAKQRLSSLIQAKIKRKRLPEKPDTTKSTGNVLAA